MIGTFSTAGFTREAWIESIEDEGRREGRSLV